MGQKIRPTSIRLGYIKNWDSRWYAKKDYGDILHEDLAIRDYLNKKLDRADVARIEIVRFPNRLNVLVHTARPGVVIGKKGADIERLKDDLGKLTGKKVHINIVEVKQPETSAKLVADGIARQLRGRVSFKKAMKQALGNVMRAGAKGVKISCGGRLGGAEMSRTETYKEGRVPLHTLRADIDYGDSTAFTTFGCIGVKVWIYKGEVIGKVRVHTETETESSDQGRPNNQGARNRNRRPKGGN